MKTKHYLFFSFIFLIFIAACTNAPVNEIKEKETVTITMIGPLSGDNAFMGDAMQKGLVIAQGEYTDAKFNYVITVEDDRFDPKQSVTSAKKAIEIDNTNAIISLGSGPGNVISPMAEQSKVIHCALASDANVAKGEYNFIHWTPPSEQAKTMVAELKEKGYTKVAIIGLNYQGIEAMVNEFKKQAEPAGISIVIYEKFNDGEKDFKTVFAKIERANPEIIMIEAFSPELELIKKQYDELKIQIPITSVETFEYTKEPEIFEGDWYVQAADSTDKFTETYEAEYNELPRTGTGYVYDCFNLIASTYEKLGAEKGRMPTTLEVANEITTTRNYDGAMGLLNINEDGIVSSPAVVRIVKDGKFVTIRD